MISEKEKKITAYHEGGHALAAWAMPGLEPVYKVTILPRGRTGGHALVVPEDDKSLMTRSEMIARLVMAMGGRAAEELVFAEPTTGASSDIAQATKIARAMVTEYGMSAKLGAVKYGHGDDEPFLGRTYGSGPEYSIEVGSEIDGEVRALIEAAHTEAWEVLNTYRDILDSLAPALLEKETLERRDLQVIFAEVEKRPTDHHLRRVRRARAVRPAADQDAGRAGASSAASRGRRRRRRRRSRADRCTARPARADRSRRSPGKRRLQRRPPGCPARIRSGPVPPARRAALPPNWTGGVLPGPLAPMPGWQLRRAGAGPQRCNGRTARRPAGRATAGSPAARAGRSTAAVATARPRRTARAPAERPDPPIRPARSPGQPTRQPGRGPARPSGASDRPDRQGHPATPWAPPAGTAEAA